MCYFIVIRFMQEKNGVNWIIAVWAGEKNKIFESQHPLTPFRFFSEASSWANLKIFWGMVAPPLTTHFLEKNLYFHQILQSWYLQEGHLFTCICRYTEDPPIFTWLIFTEMYKKNIDKSSSQMKIFFDCCLSRLCRFLWYTALSDLHRVKPARQAEVNQCIWRLFLNI